MDSYSAKTKRWIVPLDFVFSFAWALELLVRHCLSVCRLSLTTFSQSDALRRYFSTSKAIAVALIAYRLSAVELAFWLYLLHQNPQKEEWFNSWEYRFWSLGRLLSFRDILRDLIRNAGSLCAILGMPVTALVARTNVDTVRHVSPSHITPMSTSV